MGQATLDLPDPTQFPGELTGLDAGPMTPEALASADDLLSQLAGEDIDRLLSEAEAERTPAPAPVAPAVAPGDGPTIPDHQAVVLAGPEPQAAAEQAAVAAAAVSVPLSIEAVEQPAVSPSVSAEIDAILGPVVEAAVDSAVNSAVDSAVESSVNKTAEPVAPTTPPADPAASCDAPSHEAPSHDVPGHEASSHDVPGHDVPGQAALSHDATFESPDQKVLDEAAAHVAQLMDPPPAEAAVPSAIADAAERQALSEPLIILPRAASGAVSPLVRVLQWINWPMTLVSDHVREAIGKVAIVTTFNAAAVIVYVMVFRHPHH
jgi:hypothetical protein